MATYEFWNKRTKKLEEHIMPISEYDAFKRKNKHLERYFSDAPGFNYTPPGDFRSKKTDNTWKEVLSKIAEKNPATPMAEQYGRKSIKDIKTNKVLEKHRKPKKQP